MKCFYLKVTVKLNFILFILVGKCESLMQDHAIVKKTLLKYEQTLTDLDTVFRNGS